MTRALSRRSFVKVFAASGAVLTTRDALRAAPAPSSLEALRKSGAVRIGVANEPPYSGLAPDGTLTGFAPALVQTIMGRLGVPHVSGVVAPYGQLIPGLMAGRWDFIGASLTISAARCAQVRYSDPITFDGGVIFFRPQDLKERPSSVHDIAKMHLTVGVLLGGNSSQICAAAGVSSDRVRQFPDAPSLIDGMLGKRIDVALSTYSSTRDILKKRQVEATLVYPVPDAPPHGSGPAFRSDDKDLYDSFQRELRAMKASGEFVTLARTFGFEPPSEFLKYGPEHFCAMST